MFSTGSKTVPLPFNPRQVNCRKGKITMKILLACFAVAALVLAEDVFFYDKVAGHMVHRLVDKCYAMPLTSDQQANVHDYAVNRQLHQLMRDLANDDNSTSAMALGDATDFILHHCHNKNLLLITQ